MKPKLIYIYLSGLIPMIVGLSIFFIYWIAKVCFVYNLEYLQMIGFIWTLFSLLFVFIGFIYIGYIIYKFKKVYIKHCLYGFIIMLLNIPLVSMIISKVNKIDKYVYVKLYNKTSIDNLSFRLENKYNYFNKIKDINIGIIDNDNYVIYKYIPPYYGGRDEDQPIVKIENNFIKDSFVMPRLYDGGCLKITLDNDMKPKFENRKY